MSKTVIQSGICGFTTEVIARADSRTCSLVITSDCKAIQGLAEELRQVDPMEEITYRGEGPLTLRLARKHCPHPACPVPSGIISDVNLVYLKRLQEFCEARGAELILLSPPMKWEWGEQNGHWKEMKEQVRENDINGLFRYYFDRMVYLSGDELMEDDVHMSPEFLKENRERLVRDLTQGL